MTISPSEDNVSGSASSASEANWQVYGLPCFFRDHESSWYVRAGGGWSCDICHPTLATLEAEGYDGKDRSIKPAKKWSERNYQRKKQKPEWERENDRAADAYGMGLGLDENPFG